MPAGKSWSEYNEHLVKRGEFYLSLDFVKSWDTELTEMNHNKRGHPYYYPESLIMFLAVVYHVMRISYRALEGLLRALHRYVPALQVADYTTIAKRIKRMKLPLELLKDDDNEDIAIAADSTGMKVTNRGDWIRKKWKVRKGWVKVHIIADASKEKKGRRKVMAIEVTDERVADSKKFGVLLEKAQKNVKNPKRIKEAYLDGAYDSREIFNKLEEEGIEPVIRVRKNSSIKARGSLKRAEVVRSVKLLGYKEWSKSTGYGYRWIVESIFSAVKRMFGETLRARNKLQMIREVIMRFLLYNAVIAL